MVYYAVSDAYDGPSSAPKPQRVRAPKEPPKIPRGTWVVVCPDDPDLRCFAQVQMCLIGARVEVRFRNGGWLIVPRSLISLQ